MALVGAQFVNAVSPNPVGSLQAFAGASAPSGWLLCDGTSYSTSVYPELFSVLGYTYGGSGANFNVPDLRGRMPIGSGNDGTAANNATRTRGDKGGDTRLQSHTHDIQRNNVAASSTGTDTSTVYRTLAGTGATYTTTQSNGSGSGENMPPFLVTNYIIKAVPDAPRSGLAYGSTPPIVTALPANPQFGDVVTYIADAANGVAWNLQYDATGTYPWKFIGGSPLYAFGGGGATNSTSYVDCGGASMTIALSGDYVFDYKCHFQLAAGESGFISCFFGTTATDANGSVVYGSSANIDVESGRTTRQTIATAGSTVKTQNRMGSAVSRNFTNQTLLATPVRVKAA